MTSRGTSRRRRPRLALAVLALTLAPGTALVLATPGHASPDTAGTADRIAHGDIAGETRAFVAAGVDGIVTVQPDLVVAALAAARP